MLFDYTQGYISHAKYSGCSGLQLLSFEYFRVFLWDCFSLVIYLRISLNILCCFFAMLGILLPIVVFIIYVILLRFKENLFTERFLLCLVIRSDASCLFFNRRSLIPWYVSRYQNLTIVIIQLIGFVDWQEMFSDFKDSFNDSVFAAPNLG